MADRTLTDSLSGPYEVLTVKQQWDLVEQLRLRLNLSAVRLSPSLGDDWSDRDVADGELPNQCLADLEHAWRGILVGCSMPPLLMDRARPQADSGARIAGTPLEAVATYLAYGYYPPPELLLAVRYALGSYFDGGGDRSLEECFFGKPRRKAGNHSARRGDSHMESRWAFAILAARRNGCATDIEAAEEIVVREKLTIDAESLLRRARKHWTRTKQEK